MGNAESQVKQQLQKFVDNVPDRQAGQYQQHYPPEQHNHQAYHPFDSNDDAEYTTWRQRAHQEAELRNQCYEQSQEAYRNGDGARAKELSNQGHEHDRLMREYNQCAADHVYQLKNGQLRSDEIDLHGLFVQEAIEKAEERIDQCKRQGADHLIIIVGRGNHSIDHIARIKPAIEQLVDKYDLYCEPDNPNPGCLYIDFRRSKQDMDPRLWDQLEQRIRNSGECVIS